VKASGTSDAYHTDLLAPPAVPAAEDRTHYLRVYMTHLRHKLEAPAGQKLIRTEPGIGYRLVAEGSRL
jgi:two-component system KDP operon response regulator KdpE